MISIIVSSVSPEQNEHFKQNVKQTIGDTPYELLIHDNRKTHWGLCKLYNELARRSAYDILCFLHEDILFHTIGWGKILTDFLGTTPDAGVIGFAGTTLKTKANSGWGGYKPTSRLNIIQHRRSSKIRHEKLNPDNDDFSPVAIIDGVTLIVRKKIWVENPFDERTFQGFHLYDLDFSMQIAQKYSNYVCQTIQIEHFSPGSFSGTWYRESLKFHEKWDHILPFSIHPYSKEFIQACEDFCEYKHTKLKFKICLNNAELASIMKRRLCLQDLNKNQIYYNLKLVDRFIKCLFRNLFNSHSIYVGQRD